MYPVMGNPYIMGIYGFFHPQESLENTINTIGTLLGYTRPCPLIEGIFQSHMLHGTGIFTIH